MKLFIQIIFTSYLIFITQLNADIPNGKKLFNTSECLDCHELEDFKHDDEKINSFNKLHYRVQSCAFVNDALWFDKEIEDVIEYLNDIYYHYKVPIKRD